MKRVSITLTILLCMLLSSSILQSQDEVTFLIKDEATDTPIENVFIFVENTSLGAITDEYGKAQLQIEQQEHFTIVITHILYKTQNLNSTVVQDGLNVISLKEKEMSLSEVTIRSKRTNTKKRKKWLRQFEKAFLGNKVSRKKVQLHNPEVIWFEETDTVLRAFAVDNLKILNKELGYKVQFVLEEFSLSNEQDIRYRGKLFFEDIKEELKRKSKIDKRRNDTYLKSSQLFFRSLIAQHPINEKLFEYGITKPNKEEDMVFHPSTYDSLDWQYGSYADTLYIDNYLTVINKSLTFKSFISNGKRLKSPSDHQFTSFLSSKTGKFIISHEGYLVNQNDIDESGFWATMRTAEALPINFTGNVIFNDDSPKVIVDKLLAYSKKEAPEKIYVHTDKSHYFQLENMWFKIYLVDAVEHTDNVESAVVYVDLVDSDDKVVQNWMLHKDEGLVGDFQWTPRYTAGKYRIRAYTSHMRNQAKEFFFEKEITLDDLSGKKEASPNDTLAVQLTMSFYPEGGDLILDKSTQLAFHVKDTTGKHVELSGSIYNSEGDFITDCRTIHNGFGLVQFKPENQDPYYFKTKYKEKEYEFPLPKAYRSGFVLSINTVDKEEVLISIDATGANMLEGAFLIGHARGEIFALISDLDPKSPYKISKNAIPQGVLHFTIFDGRERPQAERLIFNDYNYDESLVSFGTNPVLDLEKESSDLFIKMDSLLINDIVDASVSITDISNNKELIDNGNIKDYLLLESDVPIFLDRGGAYLHDINDAKRFYLDLILRTQSWRRFVWKDLLVDDFIPDYPKERGYSISGYTTKKDNTKRVNAEVMITALGPELVYDKIQTDEFGNFRFNQLTPTDSITYIVQARTNNGDNNEEDEFTEIDGNRLVDLYLSKFYPEISVQERDKLLRYIEEVMISKNEISELRAEYNEYRKLDSVAYSLEGPEISIKGSRRSRTSRAMGRGYIDLDYADWVPPSMGGTTLLSKISPRLSFVLGAEGKMYALTTDFQGAPVRIPMQIIIDGMGAEPGGSNAGPFLGLRADDIKTISVGAGFAVITTRAITRSREKYLESGIIHFDHPGYSKAREFSDLSVNELTSYSSLATLHWESQVTFDENGEAHMNIQHRDETSSYIVKLEGVSASGQILSHTKIFNTSDMK